MQLPLLPGTYPAKSIRLASSFRSRRVWSHIFGGRPSRLQRIVHFERIWQKMYAFVKEARVLMRLYQPNQELITGRVRSVDALFPPGIYTFEVHVNENGEIAQSGYTIEGRFDVIN